MECACTIPVKEGQIVWLSRSCKVERNAAGEALVSFHQRQNRNPKRRPNVVKIARTLLSIGFATMLSFLEASADCNCIASCDGTYYDCVDQCDAFCDFIQVQWEGGQYMIFTCTVLAGDPCCTLASDSAGNPQAIGDCGGNCPGSGDCRMGLIVDKVEQVIVLAYAVCQ